MGILQKIVIFLVVFVLEAGYMGNPIFPWVSKFDEAKFVEALNESDAAALESMCSKRLKEAYPDLAAQLAEFLALTDGLMEEPLVKGDYDDYVGVLANILKAIDKMTGTETPWGSYYCSTRGSGGTNSADYWNYVLYFGDVNWEIGSGPHSDRWIDFTWAHMPGKDKGLTKLSIGQTPEDGSWETLFQIEVDWD